MAEETLTKKDIQELLAEQTTVILDAVDEKVKNLDLRFTEKLDKLTTTLDKFLKRMTEVKKVIKEKLGVELS